MSRKDDYTQPSLPHPWTGLNSMWSRFAPISDKGFATDFAANPHQRYWEMFLACEFMNAGFCVDRRPDGLGPDFRVERSDLRPVWVEATAPEAGTGRKAVPHPQCGDRAARGLAIMRRYTQAMGEKRRQWNRWQRAGVVSGDEPFILAVNGWNVSGGEDVFPPYIVRAVFDVDGELMPANGERWVGIFRHPSSWMFSGVLFACDCIPACGTEITLAQELKLENAIFVHNPCARTPLPHGWMGSGCEIWLEGQEIPMLCFASERGIGRTPLGCAGGTR